MDKALEALAEKAGSDASFAAQLTANPVEALQSSTAQATVNAAFSSDVKFFRIAIGGLIALVVLVVAFGFALEVGWTDKALPDWIPAIATTALGAIVGVFAPSPTSRTSG